MAGDFLSQDEVDALLKGVTGDADEPDDGSGDSGGVRTYNVGTQERIVRGRMPTLELINERFVRYLRIGLFNYMHRNAEISVGPIRVQKYGEFIRNLVVPTNLNLVSMWEPSRDILYSTMSSEQLSSDRRWIGTLRRQLQSAEVEMVVSLGKGDVTLRDIMALKIGDVVPISIPDQVNVEIDNVPVLKCTYGQQNGRYAIKVEEIITAPPEIPIEVQKLNMEEIANSPTFE